MSKKVMVIDNSVLMREHIARELGKSADLLVIDEGDMNLDTMNRIKLLEPEIVLLSVVPLEYEAAKTCVRLLIDDSSVKFLTLSRYENRYFMLALFDSLPAVTEDDENLISRILSMAEQMSDHDVGHATGSLGKYILKGVSLQCA
jgi:chemotaxis response regulator CheB